MQKLIKLNDQHYIIVDDSVIKEGDYYIDDTNTIRQSVTSDKDYWSSRADYKKITHSTEPLEYKYGSQKQGFNMGTMSSDIKLVYDQINNLMTKTLNISQILVYYDFPEIFVAYDNVGTNYLCLLVSADNEQTSYISTAISNKRLSNFINGKVDLRDIFENPEIGQWLFFDQLNETIEAKEWEGENLPNEYLPDQGFLYQKQNGILK